MNPALWKLSVVLPKAEAADAAALLQLTPPRPEAALVLEEPFSNEVTVEALYAVMPDDELLRSLMGREVHVALLPDQDWIKLSHEGLPPVRAGRFFVYGSHDRGKLPPGVIPIRIEAGMAFGTGHHETTALCLAELSQLAKRRRFRNTLDLGCGTGVLAIGAAKLWRSHATAADIDPQAIPIVHENARANEVAIVAVRADGLCHSRIAGRAPFDLVLANILAAPLTRLAPAIARALEPSGFAVLSGLLRWQENLVLGFYQAYGLVLRTKRRDGAWSALVLERVSARC
jgi:ribosomal protein L11 methyltransferase